MSGGLLVEWGQVYKRIAEEETDLVGRFTGSEWSRDSGETGTHQLCAAAPVWCMFLTTCLDVLTHERSS